MSKQDVIEFEGVVTEVLPSMTFKVTLSNGHVITAYISGKLRQNFIRIIEGDKVKIVIMLRGREMQHTELAFDLANRFITDVEGEPINVEKKPSMEGRNLIIILAPSN